MRVVRVNKVLIVCQTFTPAFVIRLAVYAQTVPASNTAPYHIIEGSITNPTLVCKGYSYVNAKIGQALGRDAELTVVHGDGEPGRDHVDLGAEA